jgi:hypothetical protein
MGGYCPTKPTITPIAFFELEHEYTDVKAAHVSFKSKERTYQLDDISPFRVNTIFDHTIAQHNQDGSNKCKYLKSSFS